MYIMHNYYITEGVDAAKLREEAHARIKEGKSSVVHTHPITEACNNECETYLYLSTKEPEDGQE